MTENEVERIDALTERMSGGYIYSGDGKWSEIKEVVEDGDVIEFRTEARGYDSIPRELREQAYDAFDGEKVVVGCDIETGAGVREMSEQAESDTDECLFCENDSEKYCVVCKRGGDGEF
jgi:hypothetical protein